jgi:hypothetical protein
MAKQTAMSLQARRARPFVETGIALATAGILVAVPAIAPPLTARDAQVAADVQKALSTAEVNLALSAEAISAALLAFQGGGPVNAVLAGIAASVGEDTPLGAALLAFQGGGPLGAVIAATVASVGEDTPLGAALAAFQDGGPVGAVIGGINAVINPPEPEPEPPGDTTALAAQPGASTPIASVAGVFGQNAATITPSQAGGGATGGGATSGGATSGGGTSGGGTSVGGTSLVRNSPNFSPNPTILPVGSQSGAGAGGWNLFQGIKDAFNGFAGHGGSLTGPANATDSGAANGDEKG